MRPNPQKTPDLVTFTEEILNAKLHFLYSATLEPSNLIALKAKSALIRSISNHLVSQNWRSDSPVIEIDLNWLDSPIFIVPFAIKKESIKPSLFKFSLPCNTKFKKKKNFCIDVMHPYISKLCLDLIGLMRMLDLGLCTIIQHCALPSYHSVFYM